MEEKDITEMTTDETVNEQPVAPAEEAPEEVAIVDDDPIESENVDDVDPIEPEEVKEPEPASEEPKKKKKLKKWQIALICVGGFFVLVGIAVGIFFLVGYLTSVKRKPLQVDFHNTKPAYAVSYTDSELALINSAMANGASEATIREAIAMIYNKANDNKINHTTGAVAVLRGQGGARLNELNAGGTMIVRGIKAQSGDKFYYQKGAAIVVCSVSSLQSTLEGILNQQERTYTDGDDFFLTTGTLKGKQALISKDDEIETKTIPFIKMDVPSKKRQNTDFDSKEAFYEAAYYLDDPREITNFRINKDTVVLKTLEEGQKYIEIKEDENGDKYYVCRFSLLIEGEGHDECVEISRKYLRDSSGSDNLEYGQYDIRLEVWDNGYLKMMHDDEQWQGTISLLGKSITTASTNWYESIIFYNYDETILTEEDAEEYRGDDEGATWVEKLVTHYKAELDNAPAKDKK